MPLEGIDYAISSLLISTDWDAQLTKLQQDQEVFEGINSTSLAVINNEDRFGVEITTNRVSADINSNQTSVVVYSKIDGVLLSDEMNFHFTFPGQNPEELSYRVVRNVFAEPNSNSDELPGFGLIESGVSLIIMIVQDRKRKQR
ncbi:MAG: hypothetical protein HeimC2_27640 [Candidatus Heimdallarchaeota archaeon LC_2]|nr:MAG: hypothetical protein HeimC2_27640 [Candidatus Heimdallarchaeota archaeon LC_2]